MEVDGGPGLGRFIVLHSLWTGDHNDECEACDKGGALLCCDLCNLAWHLECARKRIKVDATEVNNGALWPCPECYKEIVDKRRTAVQLFTQRHNEEAKHLKGIRFTGGMWRALKPYTARMGARALNGANGIIGTFKTAREAAVAHDIAARSQYGDAATCNYPLDDVHDVEGSYAAACKAHEETVQLRGVVRSYSRWRAEIKRGCRKQHIGYFETPEQAARAYDEAALWLYGNSARCNSLSSDMHINKGASAVQEVGLLAGTTANGEAMDVDEGGGMGMEDIVNNQVPPGDEQGNPAEGVVRAESVGNGTCFGENGRPITSAGDRVFTAEGAGTQDWLERRKRQMFGKYCEPLIGDDYQIVDLPPVCSPSEYRPDEGVEGEQLWDPEVAAIESETSDNLQRMSPMMLLDLLPPMLGERCLHTLHRCKYSADKAARVLEKELSTEAGVGDVDILNLGYRTYGPRRRHTPTSADDDDVSDGAVERRTELLHAAMDQLTPDEMRRALDACALYGEDVKKIAAALGWPINRAVWFSYVIWQNSVEFQFAGKSRKPIPLKLTPPPAPVVSAVPLTPTPEPLPEPIVTKKRGRQTQRQSLHTHTQARGRTPKGGGMEISVPPTSSSEHPATVTAARRPKARTQTNNRASHRKTI